MKYFDVEDSIFRDNEKPKMHNNNDESVFMGLIAIVLMGITPIILLMCGVGFIATLAFVIKEFFICR